MILSTIIVASLIVLVSLSSSEMNSSLTSSPWPTFHQNPQHTGLSPFQGPSVPVLKWKFRTGGGVLSSPAVAFGTIYFGSDDGNLYALNRQGHLKWKFTTGGAIESSPSVGPDGTIYFGSEDGYLYAVSSSGHLRWKFNAGGGGPASPAVGPDGTIYFGNIGGRLYAIHPDGTLKWASQQFAGIYDSPALAPDGTIYLGIDDPTPAGQCAECLQALNPDGTIKWGSNTGQVEISSPVVDPAGTIYIGTVGNVLSAVGPDGTIRWNLIGNPDESFDSSAAIGRDGTVYFASHEDVCNPMGCDKGVSSISRVYALHPNGTQRWEFTRTGKASGFCCIFFTSSSPAIGSNGLVYVGGNEGNLYAISPNGSLLWSFATGSPIGSSPTIDLNGTLYVGSSDGNLYAIG